MTSNELKIKVDNAIEAVAKAQATIERHKKQAEKKRAIIRSNGWEIDKKIEYGRGGEHEAYWTIVEYEQKLEDIENATKKLEDKKRILENWREKLRVALENERKIEKEIPEPFITVARKLVEEWDKYDIELKEEINNYLSEHSYNETIKKYTGSVMMIRRKSSDEIHRENERTAKYWVLDLWDRVKEITGDTITEINVYNSGYELNGYVKGTKGTARVETILAGGWNIQRLHTRCLVHKVA